MDDIEVGALHAVEAERRKSCVAILNPSFHSIILSEWDQSILPALRAKAIRDKCGPEDYRRMWDVCWHVITQLFDALHANAVHPKKGEEPKGFWNHMTFDIMRTNDETRGIAINKAPMVAIASTYLSHPEICINRLDWIFLDSIIFAEWDAFGEHVAYTKGGTGSNLAMALAGRRLPKYLGYSFLLWILRLGYRYGAPGILVYFLLIYNRPTAAAIVGGLWILFTALRLITYPSRRRLQKHSAKLLEHLAQLYAVLADHTISPRKLKEHLDAAADAGVVLDGAVYTIVDRILARDPTAFIPSQR